MSNYEGSVYTTSDGRRRAIDRGDCISMLERMASVEGIDLDDRDQYPVDYYTMSYNELLACIFDILEEKYPE